MENKENKLYSYKYSDVMYKIKLQTTHNIRCISVKTKPPEFVCDKFELVNF